jgi:hypothetical protein
MTPDGAKAVISSWRGSRRPYACDVEVRETLSPKRGVGDDYNVVYDVIFEPNVLDKARVELWFTDAGYIAVGFENYERFCNRLQITSHRHGFVAGHEPREVSQIGLIAIMDAISNGNISLRFVSKLGVLLRVGATMREADLSFLRDAGYDCTDWISILGKDTSQLSVWHLSEIAPYRPW